MLGCIDLRCIGGESPVIRHMRRIWAQFTEFMSMEPVGVGYHGDSKTAHAGTGSYVTAIRASLLGQPEGMSGTLSYQVNLSGSG